MILRRILGSHKQTCEEAEVLRVMAVALKFALIASSLVAVSNGYCTQYSDDCSINYVCCNNECVFGSDCLGQACSSDSDCAVVESCCSSYCRSDCAGYSCSMDSDCGSFGSCCDGTCSSGYDDCYSDDDDDNTTVVVLGSIFGTIFFSCMISMCAYACRRRRIVRPGRVIVGQRVTTTTITTTRRVPQANPPYPRQMPPSYQQGYPYHPPPQYEPHQAAAPPPYYPGTTRGSEQPPPYSATTQGKSVGVYAPQTTYGAVQTPSAPPV